MTETPNARPEPQPSARMKPWLRLVLFASLAMNLAGVGIIAGSVLRHGGGHDGAPPRSDDLSLAYIRALDRDERRALRETIRAELPRDVPRDDPRAGFAAVLEALRAEPFDAALAGRMMQTQFDGVQKRHEIGRRHLMDRIAAMTPAQRKDFANRIEEELARLDERRKGKSRH